MKATAANIVRLFLALAMCFALIEVQAGHRDDCGASSSDHACGCCANPEAQSCCAAPENEPAPPQPATPAPRTSQLSLDAIQFSRPALLVLPAADEIRFPTPPAAHFARLGGHSLQSLLCVRTV